MTRLHQRLTSSSFALAADDHPEAFPLAYLPLANTLRADLLRRHAASIAQRASNHASRRAARRSCSAALRRLRIGYLSADFGEHPVGELIQGVFAAHDRAIVEVYGYSLRSHEGDISRRIRDGMDHFRNLESMPSTGIADLIRHDAPNVLIDLGGYTQGARPEVLALRPAPIQLGWLGFIHGHQAPWLDGLLLDEWMQPASAPWPYEDRVLHLSTTVFPGCPQSPGRMDRKRFGLPKDVPLLASFNTSYKLDEELMRAWVSILQQTPSAWLLICVPEYARVGFLHNWRRFGGPEHLLFGDKLPRAEQADRAASCDLFLDAFRYQVGATAVSSLAAGLPILTRTGDTPLSRSGTSLNCYLGMHELVCADTASYVAKAIQLATKPGALSALRLRLDRALARTDLFNPRRSAADVEAICQRLTRTP
nr:hypothetical protein [Stenotrophomonas sp. MMGLT7]